MQPLAKLYDSIDADQRFRLFMAAMARNDLVEANKIDNGCPQNAYVMQDADYLGRKQKASIVGLIHHAEMLKIQYAELSVLFQILLSDGSAESESDGRISIEVLNRIVPLRLAKAQGWSKFAKEIGITDDLVAQCFTLHGQTEEFHKSLDGTFKDLLGDGFAPNAETVAKQVEQLREMWGFGNGP